MPSKPNRFRFRAWDKENHKMISCGIPEDGFPYATIGTAREPILHGINGYVMQSTGLLDKRGVEIFEGDIVEPDNTFVCPTWTPVKWSGGAWMVNIDGEGEHVDDINKHLKVVGNIYESTAQHCCA